MKRLLSSFRPLVLLAMIPLFPLTGRGADYEAKKSYDSYFAIFNPRLAPAPGPLLLQTEDRLAIVGDSITEQKMYSRIIETYLTVCVPQLKITADGVGLSEVQADGRHICIRDE
jgi:hypothetical protein